MKTQLTTLLATTAIVFGLAACGPTSKAPGTYETENSYVDAQGTKHEKVTKTDVSVDQNGNKKVVSKTKTTKDPKGLLNKTTTSKTEVETETK